MTAEVAIMNKNALVFAADSATTVTSWASGQKEVRFFKGANKLFQVSRAHPVGMMINGSAALQGVPWEIAIKEFRTQLGQEGSDRLGTYSHRFFDFIRSHSGLFPADDRKRLFIADSLRAVLQAVREVDSAASLGDAVAGVEPVKYREQVEALLAKARNKVPTKPVEPTAVEAAVATHLEAVLGEVRDRINVLGIKDVELARHFAEIGIRHLMTDYVKYLDTTGVVIGGYGNEDFFPSFEVFECYGFLDSNLIAVKQDEMCRAVNSVTDVAIEPFATTSMINTFRMGIGPDVFGKVTEATSKTFRKFAEAIRDRIAPGADIPDIEELVAQACDSHRDEWFHQTLNDHYRPLARVIGSLPVTDMAALAKSLIELQSLKERVTEPTESVGGPIDVAAISKHDGFIWIDRKHYFRPELNPGFLTRQQLPIRP